MRSTESPAVLSLLARSDLEATGGYLSLIVYGLEDISPFSFSFTCTYKHGHCTRQCRLLNFAATKPGVQKTL